MAKVIPVRLSDELLAQMDATGKDRSTVIRESLEAYLNGKGSLEVESQPDENHRLVGMRTMGRREDRLETPGDVQTLPCSGPKEPLSTSQPNYARPTHDLTCRCYICKPPKG